MKSQNERGILTETIKNEAKKVLNREVTQEELRLFPFLDYCWKNGGYVDRSKLSNNELNLLHEYNDKKLCIRKSGYSYPTREFYDFVEFCLFEAYVEEYEEN